LKMKTKPVSEMMSGFDIFRTLHDAKRPEAE
jgi:hypothetical protein